MESLLERVKNSIRISTNDFNDEINDLIKAGLEDLTLAGICNPEDNYNPFNKDNVTDLVAIAVITYVRINFGQPENYERLKRSYDEQKAQLRSCSKYTKF